MANKQINELTELTTPANGDLIPVYDIDEAGSEKTKKVSIGNLTVAGTFTPEVADAVSDGNQAAGGTFVGKYSKIGNEVTISIRCLNIDTTGMAGGQTLYIRNLPFVADTTAFSYSSGIFCDQVTWVGDYVVAYLMHPTAIHLRGISNGGGTAVVGVSGYTSGTADIIFTMTYFTS